MAQKSVNMVIAEARQSIVKVINDSGLPISIIEILLSQINQEVVAQSRAVLDQEVRQYEEQVAAEVAKEAEAAKDETPTK